MSGPLYNPAQMQPLQGSQQSAQPQNTLQLLQMLQQLQKRKQLADLLRNSGVTVPPPDQGQMP